METNLWHDTKPEVNDPQQTAEPVEEGRNALKRDGNNKAHRSKAARTQERKMAKASRKRNRK